MEGSAALRHTDIILPCQRARLTLTYSGHGTGMYNSLEVGDSYGAEIIQDDRTRPQMDVVCGSGFKANRPSHL